MGWRSITRHLIWRKEEPPTHQTSTQPAIPSTRIPLSVSHRRRADDASPGLSILGPDILNIIMGMIRQDSPKSLSSVALVDSMCYYLARYSQFRDLSIDIGTRNGSPDIIGQLRALSAYLENARLLPAVRELRISDEYSTAGEDELAAITTLIPKLTGLTDLVWHVRQPISESILLHMKKSPNLRLHTRALQVVNGPRADLEQGVVPALSLVKLQGCMNLHSLEVVQTFLQPSECLPVTKQLRHILLSCPNLRRLRLDIGMPESGCVVMSPPPDYCGLGFLEGECPLSALEELDIVRYPFGVPQPSTIGAYRWHCDGYPLQVCEEDYWAENFDWSRINRFVGSSRMGIKMMPYLTSVREIDMRQSDAEDLQLFYEQVSAVLQAITVKSLKDGGLKHILRHGSGLRKLEIHQSETRGWASQAISLDDLAAIRNSCLDLEELGIDLARHGEWPYRAFDILASFPKLRTLQIWFELGANDKENPIQPYTTFHTSQEIVRYLYTKAARSPPCLRTVKISSGCPSPIGFGYPSGEAFWPDSNSTTFVCRLSDRDDEAAQALFSTICTDITQPGNDFLNATQPGLSNGEFEKRLAVFSKSTRASFKFEPVEYAAYKRQHMLHAIRLAYNGPQPLSQWRHW